MMEVCNPIHTKLKYRNTLCFTGSGIFAYNVTLRPEVGSDLPGNVVDSDVNVFEFAGLPPLTRFT